jgi:SAM-dependent methyltransferase
MIDQNHPILDMGAGTGSLLIPLTKHGYQVEGYEPYNGMRELAIKKARDQQINIVLTDGSFQTLSIKNKYQLIFAMHGSMSYLGDIEEWTDAFERVYDALMPGGFFLIDLINFPSIIKYYDHPEPVELKFQDFIATAFVQHEVELANDTWVNRTVAFIETEGSIKQLNDHHKMAIVTLRELKIHAKITNLQFHFSLQAYEDRPDNRKQGSRLIAIFKKEQ